MSEKRGRPRPLELLRDSVIAARSQMAATLTLVVILATITASILLTAGQSAAAEKAVIDQIDSVGTRLLVVTDAASTPGIFPSAVEDLAKISDVSWTLGLGPAVDVSNPLLSSAKVASRSVVGPLPADIAVVEGRRPQPGEAVVGSRAAQQLRLEGGYGTVISAAGSEVGVVGVIEAEGPLDHLNDLVLVATEPDQLAALPYLYVMASDITTVERLSTTLKSSTPARNPDSLTVEAPSGALALREVVAGHLGQSSRQLMALVIGVGAIVIAVTLIGATTAKRRDFGRRRALGATRSALVVGLLLQTSIGALVGVAVGGIGGLIAVHGLTGELPSAQFTAGVLGLAFLTALVAATPVSIRAAYADPLRILRVP